MLQRARNNMKKLNSQHTEEELKYIPLSGRKSSNKKNIWTRLLMETFKTIGTLLVTNEVFGKGLDIGKDQIRKNSMGDWASGGTKQNLSPAC